MKPRKRFGFVSFLVSLVPIFATRKNQNCINEKIKLIVPMELNEKILCVAFDRLKTFSNRKFLNS
jgi:hypothetical protein